VFTTAIRNDPKVTVHGKGT